MKKQIQWMGTALLALFLITGCSSVTDSTRSDESDPVTPLVAGVSGEENGNGKAKGKEEGSTVVPGHQTGDDRIPNGVVNGKYSALYAYDAAGDYYYDMGDGRVTGTADAVEALDQATLTVCDYVIIYRGDFKGDPFLDTGWIRNNIKCSGYDFDRTQTFNTLYVHESDPRYSEELTPIWGSWGILVDAVGGVGNAANPHHPVNN